MNTNRRTLQKLLLAKLLAVCVERGETPCSLSQMTTTPTATLQENFFYPNNFYLSFSPNDGIRKVEELGTYSVGVYVPAFYRYLILSSLYFQNAEQRGNKLWRLLSVFSSKETESWIMLLVSFSGGLCKDKGIYSNSMNYNFLQRRKGEGKYL